MLPDCDLLPGNDLLVTIHLFSSIVRLLILLPNCDASNALCRMSDSSVKVSSLIP